MERKIARTARRANGPFQLEFSDSIPAARKTVDVFRRVRLRMHRSPSCVFHHFHTGCTAAFGNPQGVLAGILASFKKM